MSKWRTVFRNARKRVMVRGNGGGAAVSAGSRSSDGWIEVVLALGAAAVVIGLAVWVVMSFWPWFLGAGAIWAFYACTKNQK